MLSKTAGIAMALFAMLSLLASPASAQDYNVSLTEGCFVSGHRPMDLHGYVFYAACKNSPTSGGNENNWMDLNRCLALSDDHKSIIAQQNPEGTNYFWAKEKCNDCSMDPNDHTVIHCACWQHDNGYYTSLPFDLKSLLVDFNGGLYCFKHRAARLKITPTPPPKRSLPRATASVAI